MPFAPHEIRGRRFVVALRGYQTDEVDAFLRAVAADYEAALASQAPAPESPPAKVDDADAVLRSAEREAAEIRAAAHEEAAAVYAEVERRLADLRVVEAQVRDRLAALEVAIRHGRLAIDGLSALST